MVVIVDLDEATPPGKPLHHSLSTATTAEGVSEETAQQRPNPNVNGFSAALSCYPIARQLASQLDLNTLHDLSRTCRQFRANLLEYRDQLVRHSLQCEFEQDVAGTRLGARLREARGSSRPPPLLTSGRLVVGKCARDMVGECQRCATVVCRNCTIKPPPTPALRARHRRLCRVCSKAPLHLSSAFPKPRSTSSGTPICSESARPTFFDDPPKAFTASAFQRTPCICDSMVWLCQPCGQQLKNEDTLYVRAWTWRTRYSHYLGGVGTGAGEGNEGVECGRGSSCLAARIVEHEVNYNGETLADSPGISSSPERWTGSSYHAQEIEGIGGWLKMKAKKQVAVGDCVKIYEDEKDQSIQYLQREVAGKLRSWCSWCDRVVLGERDRTEAAGERPPSSGSSSSSSTRS